MNATNVVPLRPEAEATDSRAMGAFLAFLDRSALADHTRRAYRRQAHTYLGWLNGNHGRHPDAFQDLTGAEAALTGWRRDLINGGASPATVNQALAAATLLYQQGTHLRPKVKRPRVAKPGAPDALPPNQEAALRREANRRGERDAAIVAFLLDTGARVEECARLALPDLALSARKGTVRLVGKGNEVRVNPIPQGLRQRLDAWLVERAKLKPASDRLWVGQRGPMGLEGITKVVLTVGKAAGIDGLRPHRLRHTFATRLRRDGVDIVVIQRLMGHVSLETTQRYFRASDEEIAEAVAKVFGDE